MPHSSVIVQNTTKDQFASEPPRKVQSTAAQSPLPRKIIGMARCNGKFSIMPYRSRPQDATSGGYHCSQLWRAATKAPPMAASTASSTPVMCKWFFAVMAVRPAISATSSSA